MTEKEIRKQLASYKVAIAGCMTWLEQALLPLPEFSREVVAC